MVEPLYDKGLIKLHFVFYVSLSVRYTPKSRHLHYVYEGKAVRFAVSL